MDTKTHRTRATVGAGGTNGKFLLNSVYRFIVMAKLYKIQSSVEVIMVEITYKSETQGAISYTNLFLRFQAFEW